MFMYRKYLIGLMVLLTLLSSPTYSQESSDMPLNPEVSGNVEFWHFWGSPVRRTAIRRVIAICEQQLPNIRVEEVFKPFGDIWTANIAAVAAGSGMPDVIVADRGQLPRDAKAQIYQSLQSYLDEDGADASSFWPFTWDQTLAADGQSYGVPFETDVRVTFFNRNLLQEAGLDPDNPPQTWEEWWAAADQLDVKNEDGTFARITLDVLGGNGTPGIWFVLNNADLVRDGEVNVNTPEAAETLTWLKQWIDRYGGFDAYASFRGKYGAPPNDIFMASGAVAKVDVAGYNSILSFYRPRVELASGEAVNMEWGVSLPPYNEGASPTSTSGGFALSIPVGAENPEAAWEFIKCASSIPSQVSWSRDTAAIPTTMAAAEDPQLLADPNWQFFVDAMEVTRVYPFIEAYPNWEQELTNRYEAVWKGEMTPEEMLAEAQAAINAEIAKNADAQ
jgi:multiple sugar transport system substrate-binding protein